MIRVAIEGAHKALNQLPAKHGALLHMNPLTIVTGRPSPDYNDLQIKFSAYTHIFEDNDPTNTMKQQTTGAIALNLTGNAQGRYYFMLIVTGKRLSRQHWDNLPMPDSVITRVEEMAETEGQPIMPQSGLHFEWSPGIDIQENNHGVEDVNDDDTNNKQEDAKLNNESDDSNGPTDDKDKEQMDKEEEYNKITENKNESGQDDEEEDESTTETEEEDSRSKYEENDEEDDSITNITDTEGNAEDQLDNNEPNEEETDPPESTGRYNLQRRTQGT